jgi:hypothetical protein
MTPTGAASVVVDVTKMLTGEIEKSFILGAS